MIGLNNSAEDAVECPLCMEALEVDDLNFYPCTCGYQICRFCWHRIRTDENKLCPACRKEYPENPADFTPLTQEEMIAFKSQKKQRDQQRKQKITENRKHLANVRVVQKNLVFVVGLPPRLADAEVLKKHEYFGKYGKIHKVVINPSTTYAGVQGPSASAYVTYVHNSDALRAIQSVNNIMIDGRLIKTSLGTTKYCSHFMKNQQCPKSDCMYLHELGDSEASFTKEEMHQGKHQEYEKRLHDALIATSGNTTSGGIGQISSHVGIVTASEKNMSMSHSSNNRVCDKVANGNVTVPLTPATMSSSSSSSISSSSSVSNAVISATVGSQQKDAWPSLSISPVNNKDGFGNGKNRKEKIKHEKLKMDKNVKAKNKSNPNFVVTNKEHNDQHLNNENSNELDSLLEQQNYSSFSSISPRSKTHKNKEKSSRNNREPKVSLTMIADEEFVFEDTETEKQSCRANFNQNPHYDASSIVRISSDSNHGNDKLKGEEQQSLCSFSTMINSNRSVNNLDNTSIRSDSTSGKSSPGSLNDTTGAHEKFVAKLSENDEQSTNATTKPERQYVEENSNVDENGIVTISNLHINNGDFIAKKNESDININCEFSPLLKNELFVCEGEINSKIDDASAALSKLNIFDDNNSFFSSATSFHQSLQKNKLESEVRQNNLSNVITSQLPDLLNGIDGYQNSAANISEISRTFSNFHTNMDSSRSTQLTPIQEQHLLQHTLHPTEQLMESALFGTNMSKFFDFHKNQQQQLNSQLLLNAHDHNSRNNQVLENFRMTSLMENNRINSQCIDNHNVNIQQQLQKQILQEKYELGQQENHTHQMQQSRLTNQFSQNSSVDDDLGFDPFIETQKGLAELMENEVVQQQHLNETVINSTVTPLNGKVMQQQQTSHHQLFDNMQRTCMPPPGFHMNAFGFGVPRSQNNKISPFTNITNSATSRTINGHTTHLQQPSDTWNPHLTATPQQQALNDSQIQYQINPNHKGYSNNDWTAMDPAILSLRQFPSFPQQSQIPRHSHQQEIYMQHLTQQQNSQGFGSQQPHNTFNLPGAMQPQNSQAQVNANVQGMLEFLRTRQFV